MMAQPRLLHMLINCWDLDKEAFNIDGIPLKIKVEDIYFMTILSRRGEVVNLRTQGSSGGMYIDECIAMY